MRELPKFHTKPFETDEERRRAANLPNATRQEMATNLLVMDEQFDKVMDFIANRFHRPVAGGKHASGWIGGIIGESRTGKSWVAQYYASQYPHVLGEHGYSCPVIYIEAREDWDRVEFPKQIFLETEASAVPRLTLASMNTTVTRRLNQVRGELLIIDDSQFLFETTPSKAATNRSLIHHIANQRQCNILLVGTEGVEFAIRSIDHLRNRGDFPAPIRLTSFDPKTPRGREAARTFLYEVEALLPFAVPSRLHRKEYVDDFLHVSEGARGRMMNLSCPQPAWLSMRAALASRHVTSVSHVRTGTPTEKVESRFLSSKMAKTDGASVFPLGLPPRNRRTRARLRSQTGRRARPQHCRDVQCLEPD